MLGETQHVRQRLYHFPRLERFGDQTMSGCLDGELCAER